MPNRSPPGLRVIAVGGNSLSRGLTLERLSTSYFLRGSRAYDTLLQMGRWFGYRDGYADLCRLWLTDDAEEAYRKVTEATAELKRDFARMRQRQATPREFGLRVRAHPGTLLVTARNKMSSGIDVVGETRDISFTGRGIETTRLYADGRRNRLNFELVERFAGGLTAAHGGPEPSPHGRALVWRDVSAERVAALAEAFLVHPLVHEFQGDSIAEFLRDLPARGLTLLEGWTVALLAEGKGERVILPSLPGVNLNTNLRPVRPKADGSLLVSGKNAKLGSRSDLRHGLSVEMAARVSREAKDEGRLPKEGDYREVMTAPLLVLYLLRGHQGDPQKLYLGDLILPALALHFPGAPDPDAPRRLVHYRLNRVAQAELFPADVNDEGASDDLDGDD